MRIFTFSSCFALAALLMIMLLPSCVKDEVVTPTTNSLRAVAPADVTDSKFSPETYNPESDGECPFPGFEDAQCPPEGVPQQFIDYGLCVNALYGEPSEDGEEETDEFLALVGIYFYIITEMGDEIPDDWFEEERGGFWACVAQQVGADDIKKLAKAYKDGKLTKKQVIRIVKRHIKKFLGWFGILAAICDFISCIAKG